MVRAQAGWARVGGFALTAVILGFSGSAGASVVNSKHDLSTGGGGFWGATDTDRVCVFCHTPHNAAPAVPLWNHEENLDVFDIYDVTVSSTMNAVTNQPSGDSLLCMSCHDGTIALNSVAHGGPFTMDPAGDQLGDIYYPGSPFGIGPNIGGSYPANPNVDDLTDDHPVSFVFDGALIAADGGLGLALPPGGSVVKLRNQRVECTTCHNVHDNVTYQPFLVMDNSNSALCTVCHNK